MRVMLGDRTDVENTTIDVTLFQATVYYSNVKKHCFLNVAVIIAPRNDFYFYFFSFFLLFSLVAGTFVLRHIVSAEIHL